MLNALLMVTAMIIQLQSPLLTDDEWLADGWEITNRETYTISDYVEPYSVNENGVAEYFMDMCFTEEGEFKWAVAGNDEIVFLTEHGSENTFPIPNNIRDISIAPEADYAVISDYDRNHYVAEGARGSINPIDTDEFIFKWFIYEDNGLVGVGENSIVFCNYDGEISRIRNYDHSTGLPTFVNWTFAQDAGIALLMNGIDCILEAYDLTGNQIWEMYFLEASGGTKPMTISENGECVAVSLGLNGVRIITENGTRTRHILEDYQTISLQLSPKGVYLAVVVSRMENGILETPELYIYDVEMDLLALLEFDFRNVLPSVCAVTDNRSVLCGFNNNDCNDPYYNVLSRRFVLFDETGTAIWASKCNSRVSKQAEPVMRYMPYGLTNKGFVCSILHNNDSYRIGYLSPYSNIIHNISIKID